MAKENPKYRKIGDHIQGLAVGDYNIIYNYFGYKEEVKPAPVDIIDDNLTCPYRGLYHFNPNDAKYFFGRDVFVKELFKATQNRNFIPVLGASGSGKSSVVLAGLIPKLELEQKGHWKFTHFRPGSDPFHALALALVPLYNTPDLDATDKIIQARKLAKSLSNNQDSEDKLALSDVFATIKQNNLNHRILLIADQFEELYTQCSDPAVRRRFLDCLLTSFPPSNSGASSSTVLVTTMRADFLANALSYRIFADMLQNQDIKLGAMSREELKEVIEKPAKNLGVTFEAGLVERILNDVEDEPGNLPLLEFALTELWKKRTGKQLTHAIYQDIDQVKGALAKYAEDRFLELKNNEQKQARQILILLVHIGEENNYTKKRINQSHISEKNWNLVIRKNGLADSRLVVTSCDHAEQKTLELVHYALIKHWKRLRKWLDDNQEQLRHKEKIEDAAQEWSNHNKNSDYLLQGDQLIEAESYLKDYGNLGMLYGIAKEFITESQNLRTKQEQEQERLTLSVAVKTRR